METFVPLRSVKVQRKDHCSDNFKYTPVEYRSELSPNVPHTFQHYKICRSEDGGIGRGNHTLKPTLKSRLSGLIRM